LILAHRIATHLDTMSVVNQPGEFEVLGTADVVVR
jgi:hypothetical protein